MQGVFCFHRQSPTSYCRKAYHLLLPACAWVLDHLLGHSSPRRKHCHSSSSHQVPTSPDIEGWDFVSPILSMVGFWLAWSCDSLVPVTIATVSSCSQLHALAYPQILFYYRQSAPSGYYYPSAPFSVMAFEPCVGLKQDIDASFRSEWSTLLFSAHLLVTGLCISHHLLQ